MRGGRRTYASAARTGKRFSSRRRSRFSPCGCRLKVCSRRDSIHHKKWRSKARPTVAGIMKVTNHIFLLGLLISASFGYGAAPVNIELVEVNKIWDKAPHNAFTDLARWNERFYCVFREGRGHVSTDGKIRILQSKDGNVWESAALVAFESYDLRDAHLSVTPDGKLMLLGGAAPRKRENVSAPTGSFVSFSEDGGSWTKPQIVVEPGRWMWCVTWHKGKAYGISYAAGEGMPYLELLRGDNGTAYRGFVHKLFG